MPRPIISLEFSIFLDLHCAASYVCHKWHFLVSMRTEAHYDKNRLFKTNYFKS